MELIVETNKLKEVMNSVKKCILKNEAGREIYKNIQLKSNNNTLRIISCDGYRLACNECETIKSDSFECIIPYFIIPKGAAEETQMILENDYLTINFGIYKISFKTIKGDFIDHESIINKNTNFMRGFNPSLLGEVLSTFKEPVKIEFDTTNDKGPIIISSSIKRNHKAIVLPFLIKENNDSNKLRIKKDANIEELEKHLIKLNIMDGDKCKYSNVYCCIAEEDKGYIKNNCIENYIVQFFIDEKNEIAYCMYPEERSETVIQNKIYDLTEAGLLEKV